MCCVLGVCGVVRASSSLVPPFVWSWSRPDKSKRNFGVPRLGVGFVRVGSEGQKVAGTGRLGVQGISLAPSVSRCLARDQEKPRHLR